MVETIPAGDLLRTTTQVSAWHRKILLDDEWHRIGGVSRREDVIWVSARDAWDGRAIRVFAADEIVTVKA